MKTCNSFSVKLPKFDQNRINLKDSAMEYRIDGMDD